MKNKQNTTLSEQFLNLIEKIVRQRSIKSGRVRLVKWCSHANDTLKAMYFIYCSVWIIASMHWTWPFRRGGHWSCPFRRGGHCFCPFRRGGHCFWPFRWGGHWFCPFRRGGHWFCPFRWGGHWFFPFRRGGHCFWPFRRGGHCFSLANNRYFHYDDW